MDTEIIIVILARVKAHHKADSAWIVIQDDTSWEIMAYIEGMSEDILSASGTSFAELPALLSSLKNLSESHPKQP